MAVKTQGTMLYFVDPYDNSIVKVGCPTNISGLDVSRDQIEKTCLDSDAREYESGMPTPGTASFTIYADPDDPSHIRLHELYREGDNLNWAIGWSDGNQPPTVDSDGEFSGPTSRSWLTFNGYISSFPFEFASGSLVSSNLSVQVSGFPEWIPKV